MSIWSSQGRVRGTVHTSDEALIHGDPFSNLEPVELDVATAKNHAVLVKLDPITRSGFIHDGDIAVLLTPDQLQRHVEACQRALRELNHHPGPEEAPSGAGPE